MSDISSLVLSVPQFVFATFVMIYFGRKIDALCAKLDDVLDELRVATD